MFRLYQAGDRILNDGDFLKDEVAYNLLHLISEAEHSLKIMAEDGSLIFGHTPGFNPWLWTSREMTPGSRSQVIRELIEYVQGTDFPGITAEPDAANLFTKWYAEANGVSYEIRMDLIAYQCPHLVEPLHVKGELQPGTAEHIETIAAFTAEFIKEVYGDSVEPDSLLDYAKNAVSAGRAYLWVVDGVPVSLANIAHRSGRHGRINDVYTPSAHRKQGYASGLVAGLCRKLLSENLIPVLYADAKNPDSNGVYRSIGFEESGRILEMKYNPA